MKVVSYARFSPRPNSADCDSVERQHYDIAEWAKAHNHEIMGTFSDKAVSGADDERPGLMDAIDACKRGYALVVRTMDRFSRDVRLAEAFLLKLAARGASLITLDGISTIDETPEQELMRCIFSAIAQYQRKANNRRTSRRMQQLQAEGRRMSKRAPYGMMPGDDREVTLPSGTTEVHKTLVPCPQEQDNIITIRRLADQGMTSRAIAAHLNHAGIDCRGLPWNHVTVYRILRKRAAGRAITVPRV